MNKIRKSRASKVIAGFVGFATAVTMSFGTASAATTEELTAQIASLLATITSLQTQLSGMQGGTTGGTMMGAMTFSKTLKMGVTSDEVKNLQKVLNMNVATQVASTGAGSPGMESSYFGAKTKAAVIKFQELHMAEILTPVGLTKGTGTVGASTRALLNTMGGTMGGTTGGTTGTVGNTGPVSVMLSNDTPAMGTIVAGQATADLAHFTFTGAGTVNSIMLKRSGFSDQNTLANVYLYDGAVRLTDGYSFNSTGDITINNLGLVVNGMKTISVKADVCTATTCTSISGQTIAVWLTSFTSGTTITAMSLSGNTMSIASGGTLASIGISGANSVPLATVNAGTLSYAVWRQAVQVNTRTMQIKGANFRITGSASSDALGNVSLYVDGVKVGNNATMVTVNGTNYLSFNMMTVPVSLTTGSHTLEVRADIVKGSSDTVTIALQQASDLVVMDPQVGVNVAICGNTGCTVSYTASTGGVITIGTGSATVVIDPAFNIITNVTGGASNATIAKFKVHGYGEDVKVTSITATPVLLGATPTASGLQNVTLYFNGTQVGSQQAWTTGALTFNLGSQMIIPAGVDSFLEIRADLRTTGGTNYTAGTISADIGAGTAEGWSSKDSITIIGQTGNFLTIQTGLLAVAKNTGYANQTQNPNTPAVKIGSFVLQNQSSSESVRVTSLTVGLYTDATLGTVLTSVTTPALTNFSGLKTSETSGSGATPIQPQGANVFSVDFTLAPGATKTIDIMADTSSASGVTVATSLAVTGIGASSNTSISVAALAGQLISLSVGTVATPTLLTAVATAAQYIAAGDPTLSGTGAPDATKASYTFISTGGASTVSELKFAISGTAITPVMSVKVGSVSAPIVAGVAWLQGLNLTVPNGGSGLQVDALITYAPVGTSGVTPAKTAITTLKYIKYSSGGTTAVITPVTPLFLTYSAGAVTLGSQSITTSGATTTANMVVGETVTIAGGTAAVGTITSITSGTVFVANITTAGVAPAGLITTVSTPIPSAPAITVVGSKPTVTVSSTVGTGLNISGLGKIGEVTVTADAKGNIKLNDMVFTVGSSGFSTAPTAVAATIISDNSSATAVTGSTCTPASLVVTCEFGTSSNTDFDGYSIAAGTPKTFSLFGTLTGAAATGSGVPTITSSLGQSTFDWDDSSVNGAGAVGTDLNGALLYGFPLTSYSIRQ